MRLMVLGLMGMVALGQWKAEPSPENRSELQHSEERGSRGDGPSLEYLCFPYRGVYALGFHGASAAVLAPYLSNPDLDGFSLRVGWNEIEPTEGTYDWSQFDPVIAQATQHGKKVMLRILPGVRTPQWVYAAGAASFSYIDENPFHYTYGQTVTMPIPWDPVFLNKWFSFVAAFGAKYADEPAVTIVAVTGPGAGGEMHLLDKENASRWHAVGYSNAVLIQAWQQTVDSFLAAFPEKHLSVAIANPVCFDQPVQVVEAVIEHCAQTGCGIQGNWLAAKTSPAFDLYLHTRDHSGISPVGFQMLCSAAKRRFGGELRTAVDLSLDANASFLELYKNDVTTYQDDVAYAHRKLHRPWTLREYAEIQIVVGRAP